MRTVQQLTDGIYLKREDEHELGAFKWRGAQAVLEQLRPPVVVTASTGNHGAATAWAAKRAGTRAIVFVPQQASAAKVALIQAQARGDVDGMVRKLAGCRQSPACVAGARENAKSLRRPGAVKILSLKSTIAHSATSATGTTRLAWTVIGRLPVVQCVKVHRNGSFIEGMTVTLLALSAPIPNEADC